MLLIQSLMLLLSCTAALVQVSIAGPRRHHRGNRTPTIEERQSANTPYAITGVQTGQALPRLEIRDLQNNYPDQFNVLILAWRSMQAMDQSDFLSYFGIAGTHLPGRGNVDLKRHPRGSRKRMEWRRGTGN
jgi:hypothetical protein